MKTVMTFFALMLGVTLSACSDNYEYIEEPVAETTQVTDTIKTDEIQECLWMNEPYDPAVWAAKLDIVMEVLDTCLEVDALKNCQSLQWYVEDRNEEVYDIYCMMAYIDDVRDFNPRAFMDTVEETEVFQIYLEEVLNLDWHQYWIKYYSTK